MNELKIFKNEEFGTVRTVLIDDEAMFCLADICKALDLDQVSRVKSRLKEDGVISNKVIDRLGREQEATFINESNLYRTIFQSRKESAERFTDWVTSEVLPSIRKHGGYLAGQEEMSNEELLSKALLFAQKKIEDRDRIISEKQKRIEEMKPKEIFADAVTASSTSILIRDLAKILKQNGVHTGEKRLYKWMRENGYIIKNSNRPTQKAMELGLFEIIESTIQRTDLPPITTMTTKVTGKGQQYFINKFLYKKISR